MREKLSMCALLPDKCLTKTPKKNTKKTFDKLSFTKVTKDIYVKSRQFLKIVLNQKRADFNLE